MGFKEQQLKNILEINPRMTLKKGTVTKKIAMEHLTEYVKKVQGWSLSEFKSGSKLTDPVLKEKIEKFRVEFGLATNYRSNAGRAVTQGIKGVAPLKGRMEEAQKSIKLSDQKLINAVASLTEVESKLGVSRN